MDERQRSLMEAASLIKTEAGKQKELDDIRREIVRLSSRLPKDDPLRVAIATAPVITTARPGSQEAANAYRALRERRRAR